MSAPGPPLAPQNETLSNASIDLRYSIRSLSRSPGLTLALTFTIGIGIGLNVATHAFIRGLTANTSQSAFLSKTISVFGRDDHGELRPVSYDEYLALKKHRDAFEWIGAAQVSRRPVAVAGRSGILSIAALTPEVERMAGLSTTNGVVLSYRLWQSEFAGKSDPGGTLIRIGSNDLRVAGVAPQALEGLYDDHAIDLWIPFSEGLLKRQDYGLRNLWLFARLRDDTLDARIGNTAGGVYVTPYTGKPPEMNEGLLRYGSLLRLAAGLVFFIACANVASMLLGRAVDRSHETSVRVALGATRARLARAALFNGAVLSLAGEMLGVLLAVWTSKAIPAFLSEEDAAILLLKPDPGGTALLLLAGALIVAACALLPLVELRRDCPASVLRRESSGASKAARAIRSGLAIAEMACCCLLVTSVGIFHAGFRTALRTNASLRLGQPVLATVQANPGTGIQYFRNLERALLARPGVRTAAWATRLPGSRPAWMPFRIEPVRMPLRDVILNRAAFTADSISLFAMPPRQGHMFGSEPQTCRAAVANDAAAAILFGSETAGRSLYDAAGKRVEIIGVLGPRNAKARQGDSPAIYYDYTNEARRPDKSEIGPSRFRVAIDSELDRAELDANIVSANYFTVMGFSLIAGRLFSDPREDGECRVGVVNQEASELYFGGSATGASVVDESGRRTGIIGVVRSLRTGTLQRREEPAIFFPMTQDWLQRMTLVLSMPLASDSKVAEVRGTIEAVPGRGPAPIVIKTLETHLRQTSLAPLRIATVLLGASTSAALLLSIVGLYGALSETARQQGRELALRVALGAKRRHVVGRVLQEGTRLLGVGAALGIAGALVLLRSLPPNLVDGAMGFSVWISGPLVLAGAVAIASVLPARRALLVDPIKMLREDR